MCLERSSPVSATTSRTAARAVVVIVLLAISVRSGPVPSSSSSSSPSSSSSGDTRATWQASNPHLAPPQPHHTDRDEPFSNIPSDAFTLDTGSKRTFKKDLSQALFHDGVYSNDDNDNDDDRHITDVKRGIFDTLLTNVSGSGHTLEWFTPDDYRDAHDITDEGATNEDQPSASLAAAHHLSHTLFNYLQDYRSNSNSIYSNRNRDSKIIDIMNMIDVFTNEHPITQQQQQRHDPMTPFVNRASDIDITNKEYHGYNTESYDPHNRYHVEHYSLDKDTYDSNKQHYYSFNEEHDIGPDKVHYHSNNRDDNGLHKDHYGSDKIYYGFHKDYGTNKEHYGPHKHHESGAVAGEGEGNHYSTYDGGRYGAGGESGRDLQQVELGADRDGGLCGAGVGGTGGGGGGGDRTDQSGLMPLLVV